MASGWTSPYLTHHPMFTSATEAVTAAYTYAAEPPRDGLCVAGPPGPTRPGTDPWHGPGSVLRIGPFFALEGDIDAARELVSSVGHGLAELFIYPGGRHLFCDSSLPTYEPGATALVSERSREFLDRME